MDIRNYLAKNSKRYIIFDFDMTLFRLRLPWVPEYRMMIYEALRDDLDRKLAEEVFELHNSSTILKEHFVKKYGNRALKIIWRVSEDFEINYLEGVDINEELVEFVRQNADAYDLFIWSSNTRKSILKVLGDNGLTKSFEKIIAMEDVKFLKPAVEGFDRIFDPATHEKRDFLMVGDSDDRDGVASAKAGIDFLRVDYFLD